MATEQDLVLRLELSESDSGTNSSVENSGMKFDSLNKQNFDISENSVENRKIDFSDVIQETVNWFDPRVQVGLEIIINEGQVRSDPLLSSKNFDLLENAECENQEDGVSSFTEEICSDPRLTLQLSRDGKVFAAFCEPIDSVEEFSSDYSCYDSENEENVYDSENEENLEEEYDMDEVCYDSGNQVNLDISNYGRKGEHTDSPQYPTAANQSVPRLNEASLIKEYKTESRSDSTYPEEEFGMDEIVHGVTKGKDWPNIETEIAIQDNCSGSDWLSNSFEEEFGDVDEIVGKWPSMQTQKAIHNKIKVSETDWDSNSSEEEFGIDAADGKNSLITQTRIGGPCACAKKNAAPVQVGESTNVANDDINTNVTSDYESEDEFAGFQPSSMNRYPPMQIYI